MKLANHHDYPPPRSRFPEALSQSPRERDEATRIKHAQHKADGELGAVEPKQPGDRALRNSSQQNRPDESARHGAREGKVVVR
jgi:hypothetical protein